MRLGATCKTVGLAYVGSNPTLAATCGNARELGIPGLADLLCLVPLRFMMCRCEPLRSRGYGHMADGIGGGASGSPNRLLQGFDDPLANGEEPARLPEGH